MVLTSVSENQGHCLKEAGIHQIHHSWRIFELGELLYLLKMQLMQRIQVPAILFILFDGRLDEILRVAKLDLVEDGEIL